jgi:hypothetical protein
MDGEPFKDPSPPVGSEDGLQHLAGRASSIRQVLAAHFLRDCPHIVEIGGHTSPITPYLTHRPLSVLSIDPKTPPCEATDLNGHPCRVRHIDKKFQEVEYDYLPYTYGLVLLGYSLKPFGRKQPLGELLFSLIDNASTVVVDYAPELERASSQIPLIVNRSTLAAVCSFDIQLNDAQIDGSLYAKRRFHVLATKDNKS